MPAIGKTLLFLETRMTGHRPSYLRRIVNIAVEHNYRVLLAMPAVCFEHSVTTQLLSTISPQQLVPIHCAPLEIEKQASNFAGMLHDEYRCARFHLEALNTARNRYQVSLIVAGMFDDASIYSGLVKFDFPGIPWLGIVMRQNFHFDSMGVIGPAKSPITSIKRYLFLRLLGSLKKNACLMTIDQTLKDYIDIYHPSLAHHVIFLPDAVEYRGKVTNPDLRTELAIPQDAFVILCYGTLRENKGVKLLMDAMQHLPDDVHALLVGTQHPGIKQYINSDENRSLLLGGRIHQIDRYIDVSEDPDFFSAADIVWVAYKDYYSMSAVLIQAAQYQRPVLATAKGLIGKLTAEYNTGELVDASSMADVLRGINKLRQESLQPIARRYQPLVTVHDLNSFENALIAAFNQILDVNKSDIRKSEKKISGN